MNSRENKLYKLIFFVLGLIAIIVVAFSLVLNSSSGKEAIETEKPLETDQKVQEENQKEIAQKEEKNDQEIEKAKIEIQKANEEMQKKTNQEEIQTQSEKNIQKSEVFLKSDMKYADESKVNGSAAILYKCTGGNCKSKTVCVNAGHGSLKSSRQYTYCNPLHKPKFVSGSTASGKTKAIAASLGTSMANGEIEGDANLVVALALKDKLLDAGYSVLMIREQKDTDLDNIARTVLANNYADCHISIHFDGTASDKGAFCINVPDIEAYKQMEPVKSVWQLDDKLSKDIIKGLRQENIKIYQNGLLPIDLTQTSYSSIPTTDVELGDTITDYKKNADKFAQGLLNGIDIFFAEK